MSSNNSKFTDKEALKFHSEGRPGKLEIIATKPMATQRDLSLAYSPGVAAPVKAIAEDPSLAYDYTAKGNLVAVISNGTAILGMGNLGAQASKPVMEGKAVLFKRFADVDSIDLEVDTEDVEEFINSVKYLGPSFGGINLEDIAAPECFIIEQRLREIMDIPVFHDDQHGTAIISAAGLINALDLTGRNIKTTKMVAVGAGAACIACIELIKSLGMPNENVTVVDRTGVIYKGRTDGEMNQWKSAHAIDTDKRTLDEAVKGADVLLGLSAAGAVSQDMVKSMADKPIIFAMANPDPEITPEDVLAVRPDAIVATGRSDYPNQVNNVLGFPYIFRGALDVRARTINEEMKMAAAIAIAELARQDVPEEVAAAYGGERMKYGRDYIIPAPFDPRLIEFVPPKVAQAAMDTGVARKGIDDMEVYRQTLRARLDPTAGTLSAMFEDLKKKKPRVVFAEAEEETVLRAAISYHSSGYGDPILVGYEAPIREKLIELGAEPEDFTILNAANCKRLDDYVEYTYDRLKRRGFLHRDVVRYVHRDRNVFSACMVALGDADAMVTGVTQQYWRVFKNIRHVVDPMAGHIAFGISIMVARGKTVFIADTTVNERPSSETLADIAEQSARFARRMGHEPRVAFLSFSNFGNPKSDKTEHCRKAVEILDQRGVDFEYDGEMQADVALNENLRLLYPFMRLSGPANILIMPALHSANIAYKLLAELGGGKVVGPLLLGMEHSVQIARMTSTASDLVNMAGLAASTAIDLQKQKD